MTFLMDLVLEADLNEGETFAITPSFMQIYSYLHDRCRAVRVDLHLQQPWSSQTAAFVTCHEYCLRFEIFARFLFAKDAKNGGGWGKISGRDLLKNFTNPPVLGICSLSVFIFIALSCSLKSGDEIR